MPELLVNHTENSRVREPRSLGLYGEAAAWHVERVAASEWRWAAWSDWSWANRGTTPEASGSVKTKTAAFTAAMRAARSMNPLVSFRVAFKRHSGLRTAG